MWTTLIILFLVVYFLPTLIGAALRVPGLALIFLVNLFFGWTIAGWGVALLWVIKYLRGEPERVVYVERDAGRDRYYPGESRRYYSR